LAVAGFFLFDMTAIDERLMLTLRRPLDVLFKATIYQKAIILV